MSDRYQYYLKKFNNKLKKETEAEIKKAKKKEIPSILEKYYNACLEKLLDTNYSEYEEFAYDSKAMMPMPQSVCKQFLQMQFGDVLKLKKINLLQDVGVFDYPW